MKTKLYMKIISFILGLTMVFSLVACCTPENNTDEPETDENGNLIVDGVTINDSFVDLKINELIVTEASVSDISVQDILVNTITVTEISVLELNITTINDEFVYLAYQNFVDYYGVDINWEQLIKDVAVGATVFLVWATLSTVGGPVGTFFGAVICSEFTAGALVIGAAIDAAVSGYMAYQEGGDASYVIGHMVNGIADGFKWGAFLAPVSFAGGKLIEKGAKAVKGAVAGMRATSKAAKNAVFSGVPTKQISDMIKDMPQIMKHTSNLAADASDDVLKQAYQASQKELSQDLTESLFIKAFRNSDILYDVIKQYNPYDVASQIIKLNKVGFLKKAGLTDDAANTLIKNIQNKTIKKLDDITEPAVKQFVKENLYEFCELFGANMTKDFVDDCLKHSLRKSLGEDLGEKAFNVLSENIAKNKNAYSTLVEQLGKTQIDNVMSNVESLLLLQIRYGADNIKTLIYTQKLYNALWQKNSNITEQAVKNTIDGIINGSIKSLDDISSLNSLIGKNIQSSREIAVQALKQLNLDKKAAKIIDDLVVNKLMMHVSKDAITSDIITDVVSNSLTKNKIIEKYGSRVYQEFVSKADYSISALAMQSTSNKALIKDIFTDTLVAKGVGSESIDNIVNGISISAWGLSDDIVLNIGNTIAHFYQATDTAVYNNFVNEFAELRCQFAKQFNASQGYTPVYAEYASKICPSSNQYIADKYGDIMYNSAGYPIFDQHAIARIELPNLNGMEGGAIDIRNANLVHHGTTSNIPGYTWHHLEDGKTLILIPTELHDRAVSGYAHSGGAKLLRDGAFGVRG